MNARTKLPSHPLPPANDGASGTVEIRAQLERILESPPFRTSKRCSAFLRQVVEGTCDGHTELLKERTLGVSVFGRDPDYDTNQDPVVRNTAGQVRKRLAQYYCERGREMEVRIDLSPGSYVPEIHLPDVALPELPEPPAARPMWDWRWIAAGAVILIGGLIAFLLRPTSATDLDLFWAPLLKHSGPVVLCVGQGHTYKLTGNLDRLFENPNGPRDGSIPMSDIVPAWDRYVGLTDAQALMRFSALFTKFGKQVELLGGRTTALSDLRGKPSVLVGAFNNDWTLSLTGELRFYFEEDPDHKVETVRDRLYPDNRSWQVRGDIPIAQVPMDYAIVSRVYNPTTEQAVVVAAGIRGGGTTAAGEFLTNPTYLAQALKYAPPHWAERNVQFVLATKLYSGNPGPAKVVAAHYW